MNADDVATHAGHYLAHAHQLTGLVFQFHCEGACASAFGQTSVDDSVQYGHIYVSSTHYAYGLASLDRNFTKHGGSHAHRSSSFGHHLMLFDKSQDGCADLIFGDSHDAIQIFLTGVIGDLSRLLYGNAIGNGAHVA